MAMPSFRRHTWLVTLLVLVIIAAPRPAFALPWTVALGVSCRFSGNDAGAELVRTGSCSQDVVYNGHGGYMLDLSNKGITMLPANVFQDMTQME